MQLDDAKGHILVEALSRREILRWEAEELTIAAPSGDGPFYFADEETPALDPALTRSSGRHWLAGMVFNVEPGNAVEITGTVPGLTCTDSWGSGPKHIVEAGRISVVRLHCRRETAP